MRGRKNSISKRSLKFEPCRGKEAQKSPMVNPRFSESKTQKKLNKKFTQIFCGLDLAENSRRAVRGSALYRVRATSPPRSEVLRTCFDGELVQIQIARLHTRQVRQQPKPMEKEPSTWADSARRTIGIQRPGGHDIPHDEPDGTHSQHDGDDDDQMSEVHEEFNHQPAPQAKQTAS